MNGMGRLLGLQAMAGTTAGQRDAEWQATLRRPDAPPLPEPAALDERRRTRRSAIWAGALVARLSGR